MIYVLVALPGELPEHSLNEEKYKVWFTGVGKVNAAMYATLAAMQSDCETIVNYGTAGVLDAELAGKLHRVKTVRQRDMDARPQAELGVTPFETGDLKGDLEFDDAGTAVLSTGDNFVTSTPELTSELVDMEGYAIAKIASKFNKTCVMLKYGSDFADEKAPEEWQANQAQGAQMFIDIITGLYGN